MVKGTISKLLTEEVNLKSTKVKEKIIELIQQGSARRVIIKKDNKILLELPLVIGLGSASAAILLHAPLTAVLAITALTSNVKIVIHR